MELIDLPIWGVFSSHAALLKPMLPWRDIPIIQSQFRMAWEDRHGKGKLPQSETVLVVCTSVHFGCYPMWTVHSWMETCGTNGIISKALAVFPKAGPAQRHKIRLALSDLVRGHLLQASPCKHIPIVPAASQLSQQIGCFLACEMISYFKSLDSTSYVLLPACLEL